MVLEPRVLVVDDDQMVCAALEMLLRDAGLQVQTFGSAEAFLGCLPQIDTSEPQCLVLDVLLPGMSGLELQASLLRVLPHLPILMVTGCAETSMVVRALQSGAFDFLEKPLNRGVLLTRIRSALELDARRQQDRRLRSALAARIASLTTREYEVLRLMMKGDSNKQIAQSLGISIQTAAKHTGRILLKLQVENVIQLVRLEQSLMPLAASGKPVDACNPDFPDKPHPSGPGRSIPDFPGDRPVTTSGRHARFCEESRPVAPEQECPSPSLTGDPGATRAGADDPRASPDRHVEHRHGDWRRDD